MTWVDFDTMYLDLKKNDSSLTREVLQKSLDELVKKGLVDKRYPKGGVT